MSLGNPKAKNGLHVEGALLGFDAREMFLDLATAWPEQRRREYLLRGDVVRPKSVDTAVWPSVFGDGLTQEAIARLGLPCVSLPEWRGPNGGLWDDLGRLHHALDGMTGWSHRIVAVAWVSADGFSKHGPSGAPYREKTAPASLGKEWKLLGYDVADAYLTSGLSNSGYARAEHGSLCLRWAQHLNEHHLFAEVGSALEFAILADARIPEHAPFLVYALSELGATRRRGR